MIGYAGSGRFREKPAYATSVEMTVYVHPEARGRASARGCTSASSSCWPTSRSTAPTPASPCRMPASVALHRRFGFRDIGVYDEVGFKLGQYWSVVWLEKPMPFAGQPGQR